MSTTSKINEKFSFSQEVSLLSYLLKGDLNLKELYSLYTSIKVAINDNPKSKVRLNGLLSKVEKLIQAQKNVQKPKARPLAEEYLEKSSKR